MDIRSQLQGVQPVENTAAERAQAVHPAVRNQSGSVAETAPSGASAGDQAHLSSDVALATSLVGQAMALPEVREDKVQGVQAQLAAGSYQVSSAAVAEKVIGSMIEK